MMRKLLNCACAQKWGPLAPFLLRVSAGAIFLTHGWDKLMVRGVPGVSGMLGSLGFPAPEFFAVVLIAAEILGGTLLILGAYTHWVAKILAFVALVAIVTVHLKNGFSASAGGYEYVLLLLAACVSLMITGAGKWSVDHKMKRS